MLDYLHSADEINMFPKVLDLCWDFDPGLTSSPMLFPVPVTTVLDIRY